MSWFEILLSEKIIIKTSLCHLSRHRDVFGIELIDLK